MKDLSTVLLIIASLCVVAYLWFIDYTHKVIEKKRRQANRNSVSIGFNRKNRRNRKKYRK